jgi:hypothetical protein
MPAAERCRWTDMSPILESAQRRRFGKVGCGKNEETEKRLWWLADPFWSLPGNDRQSEHFARYTMAKILEPARNAYNLSWSNDMREMIVRSGWAKYWTRGPGTFYEPQAGAVSGHEATPNYHFVPVSLDLDTIPDVSFDLDRDASAERYAPVIAKRVLEIDPQVAVFRRGDSALVVAAYDVRNRHELDSANVTASLVIARDENSVPRQASIRGAKGAVSLLEEAHPQIMSVEIVNPESRRGAAWMREGLMIAPYVAGSVAMSDPLLFDPDDSEVSGLESAMSRALGETSVTRGKLGIYWETYGLAQTDSAEAVSLTLTRVQEGTLRRIGEAIGLTNRTSPLTIRWNQIMSVGVTSRSVVLDLSQIPRGKYMLRIETGLEGATLAQSSRLIEIR